ncbi:hypothetical protein Mapa_001833 [Marchantia paleacea]|nr:hypothetical protein Mapa_001833 [Marchantia paleacea]
MDTSGSIVLGVNLLFRFCCFSRYIRVPAIGSSICRVPSNSECFERKMVLLHCGLLTAIINCAIKKGVLTLKDVAVEKSNLKVKEADEEA